MNCLRRSTIRRAMRDFASGIALALLSLLLPSAVIADTPTKLEIQPSTIELVGSRGTARLLVTSRYSNDQAADVTRQSTFVVSDPSVVEVSASGKLIPKGDGKSTIEVRFENLKVTVTVTIRDFTKSSPIDFRTEVIGALSRGGCNQGACHGSPQGKQGFRLSLRGFQPQLDFMTLTRENYGRRANPVEPDASLFLNKALARVPHQGGRRFKNDDVAVSILREWIAEGMHDSTPHSLTKLEVLPNGRLLHTSSPRQQIVALAHFDDGSVRDVTHLAVFTSSDEESAEVTADGLVTFHRSAEVAILVRYLQKIESVRLTFVQHDPEYKLARTPGSNYIDQHVFAKQRQLQLQPAPIATDEVFLRRVYLDSIGVLPTVAEARAFLNSQDPNRRAKLIDDLLERREFGYFWALKWADVMRGNRETITERGVHGLHRYLVRNFTEDRPFDQFARDVLTSLGNTIHNPPANFYRISQKPDEAAESMAQLFLGVRIQCAKCHNHPYEAITQDDYYGFAAYFARVRLKAERFGLDDRIVYLDRNGELKHPVTEKVVQPTAFGNPAGTLTADDDPRARLADWLAKPSNPYFARSTVNRIWYHIFGRGIVEPVDDFRTSNPPAIAELLDALAADFSKNGYRVKPIIRTILNSETYQLDAKPPKQSKFAANAEKYFSHASVTMLSAEQILDAIASATGLPENFPGYPVGTRAIQLAEGAIEHNFLKAFAKPIRDVACDCARETDPSLNQVIHLINNPDVLDKLDSDESRLGRMLAKNKATEAIIEEIYLASLSRRPSNRETQLALRHIAGLQNRAEGLRDLQHALINSNEFLLRH